MPIKIRLDSTEEGKGRSQGRFYQQWSIIDGDDVHAVESDSEWGDIAVCSGGDRVYDIDGVNVRADQMVAVEIATLCNCVNDGDEATIDVEWVRRADEAGISPEFLNEPIC